ncbi:MAG: lipopolysaccharide heptosyltransferase II, partial [Rhizobacter sp.]|nr:lipopolysaccharide heptosyltransferase II [Rhizobacter sp.]
VGYRGEGRPILLNRRLPNPAGRPPMVAFYSALAGPLNDIEERPRLHIDAAALQATAAKVGIAVGAYWTFAPGAEYGPAKCWPAQHYAALAKSLHAEHGQPVLLLGSGKEKALCEQIASAAAQACRVLAGQTSLLDAIALIAAARGMVSNDSGLMHVAAAFGVPQAALFGSTSPEHTPPLNPRAQVLWLKHELRLDCSPCFARTCRFGHTRCLTEIAPQRVADALRQAVAAVV